METLLSAGADPSLQHCHGIGSALCAAIFTENEAKRSLDARIALVRLHYSSASDLTPEHMTLLMLNAEFFLRLIFG